MLKISDITIEKLKNNELTNELPELYELKDIIENNEWHDNDSVFNHTVSVLENLKKLLNNVKEKISKYLDQRITNYTRKDLLFLAIVFHDIAKKETIVKENNETICQNHEEQGAEKVKEILPRFDLSEDEKKMVVQIIKNHGKVHLILNPDNNKINEDFANFKVNYSNMFPELILISIADMLGCQLKDNKPDEFNFRMRFLNKVIEDY